MGQIIFITGMSGSGKSTVGRRLADRFDKSLLIEVDELRGKVVSGYARPEDGEFGAEAVEQFRLARAAAAHMARLYADRGFDVVIDDVCVPPDFAEHYSDLFSRPDAHRVLLYPRASVVIERILQRGGPPEHVEYVPVIYDFLESMPKDGWIVLDSSSWSADRTVDGILARIRAERSEKRFDVAPAVHPR